MKKLAYKFVFLSLILLLGCSSQQKDESSSKLGSIDFEVSSDHGEAVAHFEKGVLLLHSFMYGESAESFQQAQELDPDFALAYWGEAMTYNHPLWSEQNYEKATATLEKLASSKEERMQKANSEFEKDIFQSVEILYGEGDKISRDDAYADYMKKLNQKYPDNHEVAAFYALSLLGSVEEGRDYVVYGKGAKIAQGILKENPKHPGALHYLIHSYDDPDHAKLALEAANNYSKVAPDAGHALHMPSHIYIALGMWDEVINSNIRSFEARLKKNERNGSGRWNLHAYHWQMYGHLQKGETEKADEIMKNLLSHIRNNDSNYARAYFIDMLGNYSAETENWDHEYSSVEVSTDDLNVLSRVGQKFSLVYKYIQNSDLEKAETTISEMEVDMQKAETKLVTKGITVCSAVSFASRAPGQSDLDRSEVLTLLLKARLAQAKNENDTIVEDLIKKAVALESSLSFNFGPPEIYTPSYEVYGEWLIKKDRYEEAIAQFEKSLEKGPGRKRALEGIEQAKNLIDELSKV
ncbi:MAG: hypothetical protein AAF363_10955 [Bacteroidota bacterium]